MGELLPDCLGNLGGTTEKYKKLTKLQRCQVTSILELGTVLQHLYRCLSAKSPEQTQNMLAYQALLQNPTCTNLAVKLLLIQP